MEIPELPDTIGNHMLTSGNNENAVRNNFIVLKLYLIKMLHLQFSVPGTHLPLI